ncbi:Interleukin-12 receptor subunit beta-2 [Operophtera brumata]|uniref:Interleukin-12 receptor subunit beta-2 n=1 Tax=Operophtera brumata TaxID=104452 RepID=A0A0L7LB50_OPEBR|nr:Interleukin-12 receptor subunit beta-2 [Operophtera brumata]
MPDTSLNSSKHHLNTTANVRHTKVQQEKKTKFVKSRFAQAIAAPATSGVRHSTDKPHWTAHTQPSKMCDNLNTGRVRCDVCRTINLAKHVKPNPDMQMYDKCSPPVKVDCGRVTQLPLNPTCIRVCTKEEYNLKKGGKKIAGILVGAVYFTYSQGVWGEQRDVTECIRRWQEYVRSINTRRPPTFDSCGKVIVFRDLKSYICYQELVCANSCDKPV